jgi:type IX secretion system PorP/SprF family membrane protein
MKRILFAGFGLVLSTLALGQQAPQFTQFMQAGAVYNPAFTGINPYADFKLGFRKQWMGIPNAPTTLFASFSGQFGTVEPTLSLPVRGRLASQFVTEKPKAKVGPKHALGGYIIADQTSPTSLNVGNLSYAVHIPLNEDLKLSVGAGLSVTQSSLNRDKLNVDLRQDPGIGTGVSSKLNPDFNAGFLMHGKSFFAGYSANYLMRNEIYSLSDNKTLVGQQKVHHYGLLGYKFAFNSDWYAVPGVLVKYVDGAPASMDVNIRMGYKELLWFGPSFRNQDAISVFAGFHASNFVSFSYAYDYTLSKLNTASTGSHEIILGLRLVRSGASTARPTLW